MQLFSDNLFSVCDVSLLAALSCKGINPVYSWTCILIITPFPRIRSPLEAKPGHIYWSLWVYQIRALEQAVWRSSELVSITVIQWIQYCLRFTQWAPPWTVLIIVQLEHMFRVLLLCHIKLENCGLRDRSVSRVVSNLISDKLTGSSHAARDSSLCVTSKHSCSCSNRYCTVNWNFSHNP